MVKRTDFTPPYVRIQPNTDPKRALDFLYGGPKLGTSRHYGQPMAGDDGLVTGKQQADEVRLQQPQAPESRPGAGYCPAVDNDWRRGMGAKRAEGYPLQAGRAALKDGNRQRVADLREYPDAGSGLGLLGLACPHLAIKPGHFLDHAGQRGDVGAAAGAPSPLSFVLQLVRHGLSPFLSDQSDKHDLAPLVEQSEAN